MDLIQIYNNYKGIITISVLICVLLRLYFLGPKANNRKSLKGKIIIITGATEGIGLTTTKQLLEDEAFVILGCRNQAKTNELIKTFDKKHQENCEFIKLDLSNFKSVLEFTKEIKRKYEKIDILINNAGLVNNDFTLTEDKIEQTFQVNTFSPIILTQELLPLLNSDSSKNPGKVINVASKSHTRCGFKKSVYEIIRDEWSNESWNFNEKNYSVYNQYTYTKLGNVYFTQYLADYIRDKKLNIITSSLHPGTVYTAIMNNIRIWQKILFFFITPFFWFITKDAFHGSQTTLYLVYKDDFENGKYYQDCALTEVCEYAKIEKKENRIAFIEWMRKCINSKCELVKFTI